MRNTVNVLADFKVNVKLQSTSTLLKAVDRSQGRASGPLLFSEDRTLLNKWFNELAIYRRATNPQQSILTGLKATATNLIMYHKNKHHLE